MMMMMIYLFFGCFFYSNINRSSYHQVICEERVLVERRKRGDEFSFLPKIFGLSTLETDKPKTKNFKRFEDEIKKIKRD